MTMESFLELLFKITAIVIAVAAVMLMLKKIGVL